MRPGVRRVTLASAATATFSAALWWRKHPSACPYGQRFWVEMPHPFITRRRLHRVLAPSTGERVLEIGPGTGYYSLDVAKALGSDGRLDLLDLQREMLDHTMRRAAARGLANVLPAQGDAQALPYLDDSFDGAYMVATLGEVPDQLSVLREIRRVLKARRPRGRRRALRGSALGSLRSAPGACLRGGTQLRAACGKPARLLRSLLSSRASCRASGRRAGLSTN